MNNAVYRKTIKNLRNRIDVKLVSKKNVFLKLTFKPGYMSHKIYDNDLMAIRESKVTLTLNKPAYIGMCILELMYEFYYDYIKNKYGNNSRLFFIDADSLMYEIKTEDVYKDFSNDKEMLTLLILQLSQNIMIIQTNQWLVKSKMKQLVLRLKNMSD